MFICECDVDEVKREASKFLKRFGLKLRLKKIELKPVDKKDATGLFKVRLEKLRLKKVKIHQYEQPVGIPAFVVEACNYLRDRITTDGLFRRPGVAIRQRELKQMLVNEGRLLAECEYSAVDVADLLKLFFRELPEPCIPYVFHDVLQRCLEVAERERQREAIQLTLLLLPTDYLNTLAYLMQFLQEVAAHHHINRMDVNNLAIVWTPNLMPFKTGQVDDKLKKRVTIVQMLIENWSSIGVVPECLYEHLSCWQPSASLSSHDDLETSHHRKKKNRRSGSLTRMLSGIKRMVGKSGSEEPSSANTTPENPVQMPHTPCIKSTSKKRKNSESDLPSSLTKKREGHKSLRSLSGTKLRISHFGLGRKHKKKTVVVEDSGHSGHELTATPNGLDVTSNSEDYVRISRSEYEDIKNRVSRIESRISSEFENIVGVSMSDLEMTPDRPSVGNLQTVQSAYKKTLESAEKLNSPTSDELVRRFSRELKIRGSSEKKVIRSPSARKIGSLRRRSKENTPQIKRNLSLNVPSSLASRHNFYPLNVLRRGKPNTVSNGLPDPLLMPVDKSEEHLRNLTNLNSGSFDSQRESLGVTLEQNDFDLATFGVLTRSQARRASSFHGCDLSKVPNSEASSFKSTSRSSVDATTWKNAEDFLNEEKPEEKSVTGRPSVAKLRSQNAGMVLAKAKLFNTMVESDSNASSKAFSNKPVRTKPREIKKRNSSKSSKERKVQKKDSMNSGRKVKKENSVPKQHSEPTVIKPSKIDKHVMSRRAETANTLCSGKENLPKNQVVQNSLQRTPVWIRKTVESQSRENMNNVFTPGKRSARIVSPLKERNCHESPRLAIPRHPNKFITPGRSPRIASHTLPDNRVTPMKNTSYVPRRSPRQLLLKSRHNNLNRN
ncbi:rho GTPase-activating protein 11A-like isoform X2 [Homalodisca vitripennis]|uniref:rho GTPase-activating protein 11A-like isoform X2 n=1 Tax=Homalodisca vitripennis TaxID=197043 RepID=UPI001EEC2F26|nr:rho GTPase-activating protein 11A-like isoform X2 [Homalodisca vitripennis]